MTSRAYLYGDIPVLGPIGLAVTGVNNAAVQAIAADFLRHSLRIQNSALLDGFNSFVAVSPASTSFNN
jgi:hypothetical protein